MNRQPELFDAFFARMPRNWCSAVEMPNPDCLTLDLAECHRRHDRVRD